MKLNLGMLVLGSLLGVSVFGSESLVTKINHPGYVMPDYAIVEKCEIFQDSVVISRALGGNKPVVTVEKRNVKVNGDIKALIQAADKAKLEQKDNGLCDGPATGITAGSVVLYSTGGCGSPRQERNGSAAFLLRNLIDGYCPVTH